MRKLDLIHSRTIKIYEKHANGWDRHRPRVFFEKAWLDKLIALLPTGGRVMDIGCGSGEPISSYLISCGFDVTGLDASAAMLEIANSRFPDANWIHMDMRELDLDRKFDGIISWDGFFHLKQDEQRQALRSFADHLAAEGAMMLTIGHEAGEVTGVVEGEEVYHASLAPEEYQSILESLGFRSIEIELEDESCGFHSVLLASRKEQ